MGDNSTCLEAMKLVHDLIDKSNKKDKVMGYSSRNMIDNHTKYKESIPDTYPCDYRNLTDQIHNLNSHFNVQVCNASDLNEIKNPNIGTIYVIRDTNKMYIWVDNKFVRIESVGDESKSEEPKQKKIVYKYTHCQCCGAPYSPERENCEYCGVLYR